MKTIAVMSPKGGVGKTTTADTVAYILGEEHGKRVLVLDGDPQGDTSRTFGVYEPDGMGMSELLEKHRTVGGTYSTADLIRTTDYSHIDIIPANGYLMRTDMVLLMKTEENQITRLRGALEEAAGAYDYCICDCGRLFDMTVLNILMAADMVVAPAKAGGYEVEALRNLEEQTEDLRDTGQNITVKVLLTMRQKNRMTEDTEDWLRREYDGRIFRAFIRRSVAAEKSAMAMVPLPGFSKNSIAAKDYRDMVGELINEMEEADGWHQDSLLRTH